MASLELGRLFSMMQEGGDTEGLLSALRAVGNADAAAGAGGQPSLPAGLSLPLGFSLPPGLSLPPGGLEGLVNHLDDGTGGAGGVPGGAAGMKSAASAGMAEGGGSTDDDDEDRGSVGGTTGTGGQANPPPRTGSINDRKCTKVLPASSSAPKYKFVVPNEYVYKFMKHLVERPFHMRDTAGKLWDCVLIQRKNKEKYEYMIQGWRKFGESNGVQEGDTVTIEMVNDSVLQLTLERTGGSGGSKKRPRAAGPGGAPLPPVSVGGGAAVQGPFAEQRQQLLQQAGHAEQQQQVPGAERGENGDQEHGANGLLAAQQQGLLPPSRTPQQAASMPGQAQQQQAGPSSLSMQQQAQAAFGGLAEALGGGSGNPNAAAPSSQQLLDLIQHTQQQQQQQQQAGLPLHLGGAAAGQQGTPQPVLTPRALSHLTNGLAGNPLGAGGMPPGLSEAHLAELTAVMSQLEKRQRVGEGPGGGSGSAGGHAGAALAAGAAGSGGAAGGTGAIRLLSDVADFDSLAQQNSMLQSELRMAQAKIGTLETGVLNIKSVLTRNTDPGLIAMTGVINLLNQMESPDFLPELGTIGRMTLNGLCSEVRRHLNGVLRMVWILRSLPDDVQQHNSAGGGGGGLGGGPGTSSGPA